MFKNDKYEQYQTEEEKSAKKSKMRKMLIAIVTIILLIVLVVVLCVVFLVILKDDDNNTTIYKGYKLISVIRNDSNAFESQLQFLENDQFYINNKYSPFVKILNFSCSFDSNDELTLKFTDANKTRLTLPYAAPFPYTKPGVKTEGGQTYQFIYQENPFSVKIIRKATNETIFDLANLNFVYSDRYIEFSTFLPTKHIYGLGERRQNFSYTNATYTIWPKDQYTEMDGGAGPDHQTYGHHPMYLMQEKTGNFHVVFLRNMNAMDCIISGGFKVLTYKITGGIIELKMFLGDKTPEKPLKAYHNYINGYTLMPFWSLGYHQSRWGYRSSKKLLDVVANFDKYDIPLDTIWSDIDYMDQYRDFTVDANFTPADFQSLTSQSVHWVPIIDFGIYRSTENGSAYQKGNISNVFIKSFFTEEPLLACVWPGLVSFPDFNHPNTSFFWGDELNTLHKNYPYSGIWLDMNEPSNFIEGETLNESLTCGITVTPAATNFIATEDSSRKLLEKTNDASGDTPTPSGHHATDTLYIYSKNLPYVPGGLPLENKTISMNATHYYQGVYLQSTEVITEIDFHSMNGFLEAKTTYDFIKNNLSQPLPFILSRSNMFGSGAFSFHWTGDNYADWSFLETSISEIFNFQLFGIPLTGVDLCGFAGNTTEELCTRFMQAGAFYPFSRNHNSIDANDQEPYIWGVNSTVLQASRASLKLRYSLLKWYYSLFVRNGGTGTVFRPLFFEFSNDPFLLDLNDHFLLGSELMVAPVLKPNRTTNWVYFVNGTSWFDFNNGSLNYELQSKFTEVAAPLNSTPPIFIRAGSIVYMQNTTNVTRVKDLNNQFKLKVALDKNLKAYGYILGINDYTNDSNVVANCTGNQDCLINITASAVQENFQVNLTVVFAKNTPNSILQDIFINELEFFGIKNQTVYQVLNFKLNSSFLVQDNANISLAHSLV